MRTYAKIPVGTFWTGKTGKALRQFGLAAQVLALYLRTCSNANMIGLYRTSPEMMAFETGLSVNKVLKALQQFSQIDFAHYDSETETVWVTDMASVELGERLGRHDKRHVAAMKHWWDAVDSPYFLPFYKRYGAAFQMPQPPSSVLLERHKRSIDAPSVDPKRTIEGVSKPVTESESVSESEQ